MSDHILAPANVSYSLTLWFVLSVGVSSGLGQQIVGEAAPSDASQDISVEPPSLLFLAWQGNKKSTGQSIPRQVWDRNGKMLEQAKADALLKGVRSFDVAWPEEGTLHPLSLVFRVDRQLASSPIKPAVITKDGRRHTGMTARIAPANGLIVSAAVPRTRLLAAWPKTVSLEVTYPIENVVVLKTIRDVPHDAEVAIAPGVRWYLDATRARVDDRQKQALARAPGLTAGVLELQSGRDDPLTEYGVRMYQKDSKNQVRDFYATIIEREGKRFSIHVSKAFVPDSIDRLEITRQRFQVHRFDNVPLRLDLLPKRD